jgi:hypothetical protein
MKLIKTSTYTFEKYCLQYNKGITILKREDQQEPSPQLQSDCCNTAYPGISSENINGATMWKRNGLSLECLAGRL